MKIFSNLSWSILFTALTLFVTGCEESRNSDYYDSSSTYPRYVSVEVFAYTSWPVDVYIGDAYVGRLQPGNSNTFSKDLYPGEKLRLNFLVYNPGGTVQISMSFDDDYGNYHVDVYNTYVEYF